MDIVSFLKCQAPGRDVHVVEVKDDTVKHVGYYFWENNPKHHALQLIRDMRLDIGLDPMDIREMCQMCLEVKVIIDGDDVKAHQ